MRGHAVDGMQREDDALVDWQLVKHGIDDVSRFADFRRSLRGLAIGRLGGEMQPPPTRTSTDGLAPRENGDAGQPGFQGAAE